MESNEEHASAGKENSFSYILVNFPRPDIHGMTHLSEPLVIDPAQFRGIRGIAKGGVADRAEGARRS